MRGATGDVALYYPLVAAAERQLNAIEDLLSRSCRAAVGSGLALTAASASTRPPNVRGSSLLRSRKALSNPSVHAAFKSTLSPICGRGKRGEQIRHSDTALKSENLAPSDLQWGSTPGEPGSPPGSRGSPPRRAAQKLGKGLSTPSL